MCLFVKNDINKKSIIMVYNGLYEGQEKKTSPTPRPSATRRRGQGDQRAQSHTDGYFTGTAEFWQAN
jgi:hypothetical protein